MGLIGRPFAPNAVCSTGLMVLLAWTRCSVDPLAAHSLVSSESGRWEEADSIQDASDNKGGIDSFRVMKWFSIGVVGPIAVFTLLAVPIHFSITGSEVRVGHYASFRPEVFPLNDAPRLTIVDVQKLRGGHSHETKT